MSSHRHSRVETNNVDPDDGKSWLCSVCMLPIFATPFIGGGAAVLHDQCSDLPVELKHNELHQEKPMLLVDNEQSASCSQCSQKCGSKMYHCPDPDCGLVLDVACALSIKILHWSHPHRLQPIRGSAAALSSFIICGVCCTTHQAEAAAAETVTVTSYFCSVCGFWIHPSCAALARVIEHEKHAHPLVLYYDVQATFGADEYSTTLDLDVADVTKSSTAAPPQNHERCICAICRNDVARRCGVYSCLFCRDYFIHVNCATSDPHTFKSVSIGEARFPSLIRLPMEDEHQSTFVGYTREAKDTKGEIVDWSLEKYHGWFLHGRKEHPFTLHDHQDYQECNDDDDEDPSDHRVCNACVKIISTRPFYSCSLCPNFFLHDYCSRLPIVLSTISAHVSGHQFMLLPFADTICRHCRCRFIGSIYQCMHEQCSDYEAWFNLDPSCALLPSVVTHAAHSVAHFLRLTDEANSSSRGRGCCDCCGRPLGNLAYECRTCPNFALHTWCAMLPRTVTHKFDTHPLTLTTPAAAAAVVDVEMMMICEICENGIEGGVWNYSCSKCEQSFHIDCIPCLDLMYKIKAFASSGQLHHDRIPTRLIRGLALQGHGNDCCTDVADEYDILPSY